MSKFKRVAIVAGFFFIAVMCNGWNDHLSRHRHLHRSGDVNHRGNELGREGWEHAEWRNDDDWTAESHLRDNNEREREHERERAAGYGAYGDRYGGYGAGNHGSGCGGGAREDAWWSRLRTTRPDRYGPIDTTDKCPVVEVVAPQVGQPSSQFLTPEYRNKSLNLWAGAVRIPTMSFDDLAPVGQDPRWDVFQELHDYLETSFPLLHSKAQVERINKYGLLFTVTGSDPSLKPVILMAHQDVVPVPEDTVSRWTYPPFSGYFDGENLHGRGASDCKNSLIATMEAAESILEQGLTPERTFILSYGFDEEISGNQGAYYLSKYLLQRYGANGVEAIIDEGGNGIVQANGEYLTADGEIVSASSDDLWIASPSTGEKGYLDIRIEINMDGGHSSIPPDHTAIGILSQVIQRIERTKYEPILSPDNPFFWTLYCTAYHNPDMPKRLRSDILHMVKAGAQGSRARDSVIDFALSNPMMHYLVRTSQAADKIGGGAKINALPERAYVEINHRIAIEQSSADVYAKIERIVKRTAQRFNLDVYTDFEEHRVQGTHEDHLFDDFPNTAANAGSNGFFNVTTLSILEPAPVTPNSGANWNIMSGTLRNIFEKVSPLSENARVITVPSIMTGNTDTKFYWDLTTDIYRFNPQTADSGGNIHTVDEWGTLDSHVTNVAFYYEYLLNMCSGKSAN